MKVSIVIPLYNYEDYIEEALQSALSQTHPEYEVLVINDASTDKSADKIGPYLSSIRLLEHPQNLGISAARNTALRASKGDYLFMLDADDYISPRALEELSLFLDQNPHHQAVTSDYYEVSSQGEILQKVSAREKPIACGLLFRREALFEIGLYNETFLAREEEELLRRFRTRFSLGSLPLPLYYYRKHGKNLTENTELMSYYLKQLSS